jgi:nucleotide-binding universal stress UspA family protein
LLLGSTTEALFARTASPILLVPPTGIDIVTTGNGSALTCGAVIAAVDLAVVNRLQLCVASTLASAANSRLYLMTVADGRLSDNDAAQILKDRGHHLEPVQPRAMIVRRGHVAAEISHAASREHAGLVVMGLRERGRGKPGMIAASVLKIGKAFVLAVPAPA